MLLSSLREIQFSAKFRCYGNRGKSEAVRKLPNPRLDHGYGSRDIFFFILVIGYHYKQNL